MLQTAISVVLDNLGLYFVGLVSCALVFTYTMSWWVTVNSIPIFEPIFDLDVDVNTGNDEDDVGRMTFLIFIYFFACHSFEL